MKYSNELWVIKPDHAENAKQLVFNKKISKDWEYASAKRTPVIYYEMIKLEPSGRPPAPRCLHSTSQFCKKYLAVFGGKNDSYFKEYNNVAFNDLCLYDICKLF